MAKLLGLSILSLVAITIATAASGPSVSTSLWCVAKNNAEDSALQTALDWACGHGGAECGPIQQGGPCYDASDVQSMASFAFNSYFLKNSMANHSCYFDNSAALTSLDPSHDKCKFPSSLAVSNGTVAGSSTAVGLEPRQDMHGGDRTGKQWCFRTLFVSNVLVFFTCYLIVIGHSNIA